MSCCRITGSRRLHTNDKRPLYAGVSIWDRRTLTAEFGNLSKAAVQLRMTQSGLSRAIVDMEEYVGGQLFERTSKGMKPTALGAALCRHANRLLSGFRKAEIDLAAVSRGDLGSLSVGCFSMFSSWPLPDAVRKFRETLPRITLSVEIATHEKLLEDLDSGAVDILISRSPPGLNAQIYRTTPLLTDPAVLACSTQHPLVTSSTVSLDDCVRYPWVTALPESRIRLELENKLREVGCVLPSLVGALSIDFGREMVSTNEYLWMLPGSVAAVFHARNELHVIPVALGLTESPLSAIWRRDRLSTQHVRAFADILADVVAAK
ncbi:MAG TPA: LysR family transcriptional regulator [Eoetvoesiella sp.]